MAKWVNIFMFAVILQTFIALVYIHEIFAIKRPQKPIFPKDNETQLVDLTDFHYIIKKAAICANADVLLLIIVSSAPENTLKRNTIRATWGATNKEVKVLFSVGQQNATINANIKAEDANFHDIIQGNFQDAYKNMTYKSTMALKYAVYNCPGAKFLMKCDDDIFVNLPLLKSFLKNHLTPPKPKNAIFCNVNYGMLPIRDPQGNYRKWYVSSKEWPKEVYPTYCSGWYAIMTPHVAFNLYKHAQKLPFFWIDDVFLTGIAAEQVKGLEHVDLSRYTLVEMDGEVAANGSSTIQNKQFLVGLTHMSPEKIGVIWERVLAQPLGETLFSNFTVGVTLEA